jgi:dienelactone hydrolase
MKKKSSRSIPALLITFTVLFTFLFTLGCDSGGDSNPATPGPLSKCTYTSYLSDSGYSSAIMYYPCQTDLGPFAATTLTGGYTNTKEDMYWLADHLVTHGYVILVMTPNNTLGTNSSWRTAHNAGISKLRSENTRTSSPIRGLLRTGDMQIMGFSKGGGGALLASSDQGSNIRATQALAPYMDYSYSLTGIRSATIVHAGSSDLVASASNAKSMFQAVPSSVDRTFANYRYASHSDWYGSSGSYRDRFKTYITGWMKVYLDQNNSYAGYIDGSQSWFAEFIHYPAGSSGGCN